MMGYTTYFTGEFKLDKPLTIAQFNYLKKFAAMRHMKRNAIDIEFRPDPLRHKVGLPVGTEGEFFVGDEESDVLDHNQEPSTQPGLWCQWVPTEDGEGIKWDGGEKFYNYVEWIEYIVGNFLKPWGYTLSGEVEWEGDDEGDMGKIVVKGNKVAAKKAKIVYEVVYED
jgi:hypothetical protein